MTDERLDEGRRAFLGAGLAGAALLVSSRAVAAPEDGLGGLAPVGGFDAQSAPKFRTIKGASDRLLRSSSTAPTLDTSAVRIALDVVRDARTGEISVQYGSGATSVGSGAQAVQVAAGKGPLPPQTGPDGTVTLTLSFQVVAYPGGKVSLITPGADPGGT